jgi:leucyl aminopeptidase
VTAGRPIPHLRVGTGQDRHRPVGEFLAVAVPRDPSATAAETRRWLTRYGADLDQVRQVEKVTGRAGEIVRVPVPAPDGMPARLYLVGTGDAGPEDLRQAGAALSRTARGRESISTTLGAGANSAAVRALAEGLVLGGYTPPATGRKDRGDSAPVGEIHLYGRLNGTAVERGTALARATWQARDLANTPSDVKDPAWMVRHARESAEATGLGFEVRDAEALAAEGFGGLLAVGAGSARPPALVTLTYRPEGDSTGRRPVVLVGKGITFDTGGLSIKPRDGMVGMKTDMAGAAAVLTTLASCRELGIRRPVVGLLPFAENAVSGSAFRPGDVITQYGSRTVEVANTDAEGRLVLADALAFADAQLDPEILVDVATLTGAATLGLGRGHGALYATDDRLAQALETAGRDTGERLWRMPLEQDYLPAVHSDIADLRHVPGPDRAFGGGSITAALFLREFTGERRWAHLDIAGPARSDKDVREISRGATGFGARVLLTWLEGLR